MNNTSLFFAIVFSCWLLTGCKKDYDIQMHEHINGRIKTELHNNNDTVNNSIDTVRYTYDSDNRLIEQITNSEFKITYVWTATTLTINDYSNTDTIVVSDTYQLNSEGYITGYITPGFAYECTYDDEGHRILYTEPNHLIITYSYNNSNLISQTDTYINNNGPLTSNVATFTYLSNKKEYRTIGLEAFGKSSENLVNTRIDYAQGTSGPIITSYLYEYDDQGRVIKETEASPGEYNKVIRYTYDD